MQFILFCKFFDHFSETFSCIVTIAIYISEMSKLYIFPVAIAMYISDISALYNAL